MQGRNIKDENRLIQYLIKYTDDEDLEEAIIFLDQEKGFDREEYR